jgi:hypothetical protein
MKAIRLHWMVMVKIFICNPNENSQLCWKCITMIKLIMQPKHDNVKLLSYSIMAWNETTARYLVQVNANSGIFKYKNIPELDNLLFNDEVQPALVFTLFNLLKIASWLWIELFWWQNWTSLSDGTNSADNKTKWTSQLGTVILNQHRLRGAGGFR